MPVSDHRKSGWTLWREIYGTFIGLLPLLVVISGVAWTVIRDTDRHTLEIFYLQQADKRHEEQMTALRLEQASIRLEIIGKMDKIGNQIEELQKQVARAMR
jgi:hypothetical protein